MNSNADLSMCKCELNILFISYFSRMKFLFASLLAGLISFGVHAQGVLFPVKVKGKWGYTNVAGKMVIPAMYDYAESFNNGRAVVALNNLPCIINDKNQRVIDTGFYSHIANFSEGLAVATSFRMERTYIDTLGKAVIVLPKDIYDARQFNNGLALVAKNVELHQQKFGRDIYTLGYKFGFINKKGEEVVPCMYEDAEDFYNGFCRVGIDGKFGFLDTTGKLAIAAKYKSLGRFIEGKAFAETNGKWGFIDMTGKEVIAPLFQYAFDFSEGLAGVMQNNKFGFVNENGALVIAAEYEAIRPFAMGMAAVKKDGKWGFIDKSGKPVLRFMFDDASYFSEGRCAVMIKRKWGFIDQQGALVIPMEFEAVGTFMNGAAEVMRSSVSVYVNKQGSIIPKLNNQD
jgi:hypothetical protein